MSILSGISTASGIAPLLNAPRETNQATSSGAQASTAIAGQAVNNQPSVGTPETERPVPRLAGDAKTNQFPDIRASNDIRYARFVEAVQALRRDPEEPVLNDRRVAELIAAAEDFFLVDDGIPREVQPLPPDASVLIKPPEIVPPLEQIDPLAEAIRGAQKDGDAVIVVPPQPADEASAEESLPEDLRAKEAEKKTDGPDQPDNDRQQDARENAERERPPEQAEQREPEPAVRPERDDAASKRRDMPEDPKPARERRAELEGTA